MKDNHTIPKLRNALVRHVLDLLERLVKEEPEKYQQFWREFGNVLKEGPAEDFANRARIAKLLRFSSTHTGSAEQDVSLDDYLQRMKANQKKIYYITAENLTAAKSSPHLEIFLKNQIEVLLLTDRIDEWVVGHLAEYEGKSLQSVAKGDLPLDEIVSENEAKQEEKKEHAEQTTYDEFLKKIKTFLDDKVKEVCLSHRLISSPACLVRDQNALGPQLERLLKAAGQTVTETKPTLELNPEHALVRKLRDETNEERLKEWTYILYEQALLAEGSQLPDPAGFVQRINKMWLEMF